MITPEQLDAIEARAKAATPGRWNAECDGAGGALVGPIMCPARDGRSKLSDADADFIAHARDDVPALVAEVRRLQGLVEIGAYAWHKHEPGHGHAPGRDGAGWRACTHPDCRAARGES